MALPFALDELPAPDQWMATGSQTMARKQDITLADSELGGELLGRAGSMLKRHRSALSLSSAESHLHGHGDEVTTLNLRRTEVLRFFVNVANANHGGRTKTERSGLKPNSIHATMPHTSIMRSLMNRG
jgi:hypothetical protein